MLAPPGASIRGLGFQVKTGKTSERRGKWQRLMFT